MTLFKPEFPSFPSHRVHPARFPLNNSCCCRYSSNRVSMSVCSQCKILIAPWFTVDVVAKKFCQSIKMAIQPASQPANQLGNQSSRKFSRKMHTGSGEKRSFSRFHPAIFVCIYLIAVWVFAKFRFRTDFFRFIHSSLSCPNTTLKHTTSFWL